MSQKWQPRKNVKDSEAESIPDGIDYSELHETDNDWQLACMKSFFIAIVCIIYTYLQRQLRKWWMFPVGTSSLGLIMGDKGGILPYGETQILIQFLPALLCSWQQCSRKCIKHLTSRASLSLWCTAKTDFKECTGMMSAMVTEPLGFVSCTKHATVHFVLWSLQSSVIAWF